MVKVRYSECHLNESLLYTQYYCSVFMMCIQSGDSALMVAATWGKTGVVKVLVKGGADLNLQNKVRQ